MKTPAVFYLVSYPQMPEPSIYLAKLPKNILVKIPIPDDAKLIGTLAWGDKLFEVVLDVPEKPKDVLRFYNFTRNI